MRRMMRLIHHAAEFCVVFPHCLPDFGKSGRIRTPAHAEPAATTGALRKAQIQSAIARAGLAEGVDVRTAQNWED